MLTALAGPGTPLASSFPLPTTSVTMPVSPRAPAGAMAVVTELEAVLQYLAAWFGEQHYSDPRFSPTTRMSHDEERGKPRAPEGKSDGAPRHWLNPFDTPT